MEMGKILYLVFISLCVCVWTAAGTKDVNENHINYRDALSKSILFFEGQRSGKLPANQRMKWRRDSALSDGLAQNVDLAGGYYDAGDNVKFGFPMAFTTTMLAWSVIEFGGQMGSELANARSAIRWATDYLLKATASPGTIFVQVGNPNSDHRCWERPEDMDTPRTVYKINSSYPGSDIAAETSAALAAASIIFRKSDRKYSQLLLNRAKQVFGFADQHRGSYSDVLKSDVCPFYCSYSGYQDELLWGAAWLQKASKNVSYLKYIQANAQSLGAYNDVNVFSWDNKYAGVRVLLAKEFLIRNLKSVEVYKGLADNFMCSDLPGTSFSQIQYTPGGLLYKTGDNNMQYVTTSTFLLFTYAKYLKVSKQAVSCGKMAFSPGQLRSLAKRQVDYILGDNPLKMSYMVGFGTKFPRRVHHRGSSLPSIGQHPQFISCNDGFQSFYSRDPNPNILVGAVVGGPDSQDQYVDDRTSYGQSEAPTYISAPLVGALAYLARNQS